MRRSLAAAAAVSAVIATMTLAGCRRQPAAAVPAPLREAASWVEPFTGMEFAAIAPGSFMMGSPPGETGREASETLHEVRLTRGFYLGRCEVTQQQWRRVMGTDPSHFAACGGRCPVEQVTWDEAKEFLRRLERASPGERFRLPTEAEWEYACRAGTVTPFSTGENLTTGQANYDGNHPYDGFPGGGYRQGPTPVGSFLPNAWGLYDMHGNVWEWCEDWFCPYPEGPGVDPVGGCLSDRKVIRGGSWYFDAASSRSALRYTHRPVDRGFSLGFRVVRESPR